MNWAHKNGRFVDHVANHSQLVPPTKKLKDRNQLKTWFGDGCWSDPRHYRWSAAAKSWPWEAPDDSSLLALGISEFFRDFTPLQNHPLSLGELVFFTEIILDCTQLSDSSSEPLGGYFQRGNIDLAGHPSQLSCRVQNGQDQLAEGVDHTSLEKGHQG